MGQQSPIFCPSCGICREIYDANCQRKRMDYLWKRYSNIAANVCSLRNIYNNTRPITINHVHRVFSDRQTDRKPDKWEAYRVACTQLYKTPKSIMRSTVPLACLFDVVKSQNVTGPAEGVWEPAGGFEACWKGLRAGLRGLRASQQGLRTSQRMGRYGGIDGRTYGRTDVQNFSLFYKTSSPVEPLPKKPDMSNPDS